MPKIHGIAFIENIIWCFCVFDLGCAFCNSSLQVVLMANNPSTKIMNIMKCLDIFHNHSTRVSLLSSTLCFTHITSSGAFSHFLSQELPFGEIGRGATTGGLYFYDTKLRARATPAADSLYKAVQVPGWKVFAAQIG